MASRSKGFFYSETADKAGEAAGSLTYGVASWTLVGILALFAAVSAVAPAPALAQSETIELETIEVSGEGGKGGVGEEAVAIAAELKDKPAGKSIITKRDLEKTPVNDLSDVLRREPGINITGNGTGGQFANKRQVDIRGVGPEYTVVLIDGKRVSSRESNRFSRSGARNTRGDTSWVPPEAIERIEVIRGPAAARYGSGAIGGVINIITKKNAAEWTGSVTAFADVPQNEKEGDTKRADYFVAGPLTDRLSFRSFGSLLRRNPDAADINIPLAPNGTINDVSGLVGKEGVESGDVNGLLSWKLAENQYLDVEGGYSKQDGLYAGNLPAASVYNGDLWSVIERTTASIAHRGDWDIGTSRVTAFYEGTENLRRSEGLSGSVEGNITNADWNKPNELRSYGINGEAVMPFDYYVPHNVTVGAEIRRETLHDENATSNNSPINPVTGLPAFGNGQDINDVAATYYGVYFSDDIAVLEDWIFTPGIRFDETTYGGHIGPSAYLVWNTTEWLSLKSGIAEAFKTPNLYQINPSYIYNSGGNGCYGNGPCYILGNPDLKPETSINKEIGFNVDLAAIDLAPVRFGAIYFQNDFENKIVASRDYIDSSPISCTRGSPGCPSSGLTNAYLLYWDNVQEARVRGLEGRFRWDISEDLGLDTNFTYFFESVDLATGETLSLQPEYTINATLEWRPVEDLTLYATLSRFGEQQVKRIPPSSATDLPISSQKIDPYTLVGISGAYQFDDHLKMRVGIANLFDEEVMRVTNSVTNGVNATYNEPGRTYYGSVTLSF